MPPQTPLSYLLTPLLQTFRSTPKPRRIPTPTTTRTITSITNSPTSLLRSNLTSTPNTPPSTSNVSKPNFFSTSTAKNAPKTGQQQRDMRITLLRYHLMHPKTPRPLRLSRLRALRHWTIHRAWLLFRRKERERREAVLERQFASMSNACEALRLLDPPGTKDAGRLYRIAMLKKGVFREGGLPIEYAKAQVERPAREAWNHGWTR